MLAEYGIFLLKSLTIAVTVLIIFAGLVAIASKNKRTGKLIVKRCHDRYQALADEVQRIALPKKEWKQYCKQQKKQTKQQQSNKDILKKRLFIIDFHGDLRASAVDALRQEIDAILLVATTNDEVLVRLESPGGMVPGYGLAASQLQRVRAKDITLTIAVDKVAASGGYMMAAVGNHILSAPFALIGSIGVVAQLPNFHRLLNKHHIDFEQITAGEYKRTLTLFGENTKAGRNKFQHDIDALHELFKQHIHTYRPQLDIETVATGEYWFGQRALELKLIDTIQTSDDYLLSQKDSCELIQVSYKTKKSLSQRLSHVTQTVVDHVLSGKQIGLPLQ